MSIMQLHVKEEIWLSYQLQNTVWKNMVRHIYIWGQFCK